MLLNTAIDIDALTNLGHTALHLACFGGSQKVINLLLQNDANVHTVDKDGWTALHSCARNSYFEVVEMLLNTAIDIDAVTDTGYTALGLAASWAHTEIVDLLLTRGADPRKGTPIKRAATKGHNAIVAKLAPYHGDFEPSTSDGDTLLHWAPRFNHAAVITSILGNENCFEGIKFNVNFWDPLHYAIYRQNSDVIRALCQSPRFFGSDGWKGLVLAILDEDKDTIRKHVSKDTHRNTLAWSPVHVAALLSKTELLSFLATLGYNIDIVDRHGMTALHYAYSAGLVECVERLLELKADPSMLDNWCRLPCSLISPQDAKKIKLTNDHRLNEWIMSGKDCDRRQRNGTLGGWLFLRSMW